MGMSTASPSVRSGRELAMASATALALCRRQPILNPGTNRRRRRSCRRSPPRGRRETSPRRAASAQHRAAWRLPR
eukprot:1142646-Alexandrium_andersonii.AAC.1